MVKHPRSQALAVAAAITVGLSGSIAASPALAADSPLPTTGKGYLSTIKSVTQEDGVVGAATDAQGNFVAIKVASEDTPELDELDKKRSNLEILELEDEPRAYAGGTVLGGAGYIARSGAGSGGGSLCSVGFAARSPQGEPAFITAGHCAGDGAMKNVNLTTPSKDTAVSGSNGNVGIGESVGTFGFSQFGGPNNSPGANNKPSSIDIAVVDVENPELKTKAAVTDWTGGRSDDLASSAVPVTGVAQPQAGKPVAKSGRTTGFTEDKDIDAVDGYIQVQTEGGPRWVHGFSAVGLDASQGDSGGAMIQDGKAVGVVSAGGRTSSGEHFVWGANLADAFEHTGGYTVAVDGDEPTVTNPGSE